MDRIAAELLAHQNPNEPHTLLTRFVISAIILFANGVLYGVYGVFVAIAVFVLGVGFFGLHLLWAVLPIPLGLLYGVLFAALPMLLDYWRNHGHGEG